jgi:hypothetical protein
MSWQQMPPEIIGRRLHILGQFFYSSNVMATAPIAERRTLTQTDRRRSQLWRVGDDCGLRRARALRMIEPSRAGYRCDARQCCRRRKRYGLA